MTRSLLARFLTAVVLIPFLITAQAQAATAGSGSSVTRQEYRSIKVGMSRTRVERIFGVKPNCVVKGSRGLRYAFYMPSAFHGQVTIDYRRGSTGVQRVYANRYGVYKTHGQAATCAPR